MFSNPPVNSNGLFGKSGTNPNMMNPNVSNFNSGSNQQSSVFTFGSMTNNKSGVMVGGGRNSGPLFSGQNNTRYSQSGQSNPPRNNNLGFGGVGGGFKNLGQTQGANQFTTTGMQGGSMFNQQMGGFGQKKMPVALNYNAIDQELKKSGFIVNRNANGMHTDTIQDMKILSFGNNNYKLVTVGWDKTLRIWNCQLTKNPNFSMNVPMSISKEMPKMYCSADFAQKLDLKVYGLKLEHVPQMNSLLIICGDCTIRRLNLTNMQIDVLITLNALAVSVYFIPNMNVVLVITYDSKLHVYQMGNLQAPAKTINLIATPSCSDLREDMLMIGMVDDYWSLVNLAILSKQVQVLPYSKCPLESPITNVLINKRNNTVVATSCDGRIINSVYKETQNQGIIFYQMPNEVNNCKKTFIFMGHGINRSKIPTTKKFIQNAYNVTSLNLNSRNKGFTCSSGADGSVVFWDLFAKNKIKNFEFKESLTCGTVSSDGNLCAFAIGYDWSKGIWGVSHAPKSIAICTYIIRDNDLQNVDPKKKKNY